MSSEWISPERNLALELVRTTEAAAMAAARWVGHGDKNGADQAAVDAMRSVLGGIEMDGTVVIGEGEKDEAPMLYNGERIGNGEPPHTDIAVDPIDGTTLTATGRAGAIAVIAVAEKGSMFDPGPAVYMEKIAVGPEGAGIVDIRLPIDKNLSALAKARRKDVRDLNVMVLDRPRHADIVAEIRDTGARITLIPDGDVAGAIATAWPESGVDILFGIGGTPEGVIAAAALKSMGGDLQGRLWFRSEEERQEAVDAGYDPDKFINCDDLVSTNNCFFAATGITNGELLRGVRFGANSITTQSLVMRGRSGTTRLIEAIHRPTKLDEIRGADRITPNMGR
ncbi:MAG: class II fructose-bisphosphatase [Actinomycetota bacterium]